MYATVLKSLSLTKTLQAEERQLNCQIIYSIVNQRNSWQIDSLPPSSQDSKCRLLCLVIEFTPNYAITSQLIVLQS